MEEYKLALESQPDSFELNYNIGCCFYDESNFESALKHFNTFLELIAKNFELKIETKNLYIADCLMSMASCQNELSPNKLHAYDIYLRAWNSIKEVKESGVENFEFD